MSFTKERADAKYFLIGSALAALLIVYIMNIIDSAAASSNPSATVAWGYTAPCFQIAGIDMGACYYWQDKGDFIPISTDGKEFIDSFQIQDAGKDWVQPFIIIKTAPGTHAGSWQFNVIDTGAATHPAGSGDVKITANDIFGSYTTTYRGDTTYSKSACGCNTYPTDMLVSTKVSIHGIMHQR